MPRHWDLLVGGGGPAGLAAAITAAASGGRVLVLERRSGVLDKACGEGLMPGAMIELARLGVHPERGHRFEGIRYIQGRHQVRACFPSVSGLGVRRTVLHEALRRRAGALGVQWSHHETVAEAMQCTSRGVRVGEHRAPYLIAADGLHSPIRRRLGLGRPALRPPRYGIRRHYRMAPWSDDVEVHWAPDAEAYVTPVAADLVGVAVLFSGRGSHGHWLGRFPSLQARLAHPVTSARGAGPFEQRVARRVHGPVLLVGDAAGYVDPLTGEGVRLGLATARAAVERVVAGMPGRYEADWQRITRRYRWLTGALVAAGGRPFIRTRMVAMMATMPGVFGAGVRLLAVEGAATVGQRR